ncbi:hypothetical protein XH83_25305 [Bradyrhizobium sp. CCBAU 53351]|uniref:alpha/beta hydrolase family protein n=1 Tax=Bradyrhizobium sp. CCBAU 53351 TaxID=1325114 RepID=UPI001886B8CE|nr:prolyl oligopeptidase family serine peptidase [Bradyrhizobium sp. CCBAU 53351]QOZ78444.1 hypothetical protein XH83_25305 [Bradyrhizobium sp. CCBAU 53351]
MVDRRTFLGSVAASLLPSHSMGDPSRAVIFWFYTSEAMGISDCPVSDSRFVVASADLPCHGRDIRSGEPPELKGWRYRLERNEDLFGAFTSRCIERLDQLLAAGEADPERVFVGGVSRGAFAAFHLALRERRFKSVIGLSPVVDLSDLSEFEGYAGETGALHQRADALGYVSTFLSIQSHDERVRTRSTIALADEIIRTHPPPVDVTLRVEAGSGHTVTSQMRNAASAWIVARLR